MSGSTEAVLEISIAKRNKLFPNSIAGDGFMAAL